MKSFLRKAAIVGAIVLGIVAGTAAGNAAVGFGLAIIGIIAAFIFIRPDYQLFHVMLGTSAGEVDAISSRDEKFITGIVRGVNDATIHQA